MEDFLVHCSTASCHQNNNTDDSSLSDEVRNALQALSHALEAALTITSAASHATATTTAAVTNTAAAPLTAAWLLEKCNSHALTPQQLALSIWEAAHFENEMQQQEALFQLLGEQNLDLLLELTPRLSEIARIPRSALTSTTTATTTNAATHTTPDVYVDIEEERRSYLREQAAQAVQTAALAKAELDALTAVTSGATHAAISRKQEKQARKFAEKAQKQAAVALQQAKDAGAVIDEDDWLAVSSEGWGDGGLLHRDAESLQALQQSLLPEGTKEHHEMKGLPADAEYFEDDNMKRIIIPAIPRDTAKLRSRLKIADIITDPREAAPFQGTSSLNPMQSTVFERAFHTRDNLLICAPTGAGKTNVAMLTVVAHLRDVGLLNAPNKMDTGHKIVYIAPMKALAQEVVEKFSSKLKPFIVRELTGDMQLTRAEAESAHVIVTTPEKWDVVTRKSGTDETSLGNQCGLLIIDEVHLLADERGAVVESVVARLHRLVESRQKQVRIVALSATLPNYLDVADFLQVPSSGVFFFGPEHRPVPLQQQFIGVGTKKMPRDVREQKMNDLCFEAVLDSLKRGYQVMVFVHSRKGTGDTARALAEQASSEGLLQKYFVKEDKAKQYTSKIQKSRNRQVAQLFDQGLGIHHAGMLRGDRKLTEQMFFDGAIQVLCCTATLAWGVNLPAHTVIIKGTDVYNPEKGGNVDLSILDVQQIFGRAGRPQFDSSGEAILITSLDAFPRYMDKLVRPIPIESNFSKQLADHLNAEIVGRTVTNITEAATWLTYTYMYIRMGKNPLHYGMRPDDGSDPLAVRQHCVSLVTEAAKLLDANKMITFHPPSGNLSVKDKGHVAAHYYIQAESIEIFNERFSRSIVPTDSDLCRTICLANEFNNLKLRPEELEELQTVAQKIPLRINAVGADDEGRSLIADAADKAFVLLQAFVTREKIKSFTLISDTNYIESNAARIARALFEMSKRENRSTTTVKLLRIAKSIEKQLWWFQTPLRQFEDEVQMHVYKALESYSSNRSYDSFESTLALLELQASEVGQICKSRNIGGKIQQLISMLPRLELTCNIHPVTRAVLRMHVVVEANFTWSKRWHGATESFWIMVEDPDADRTYHAELVTLQFRTYQDPIELEIWIPAFETLPDQYTVRAISDTWVGVEQILPVLLHDVQFPASQDIKTDVLDLTPLPISALQNDRYEKLYTKFETFNPIQTQLFHVLYHTDSPVFLGAPTGSGKTIVAELAILRMKTVYADGICVYIAPLKALARERLKEWQKKLAGWTVLELSGDTHHDQLALQKADILVCTPEKWDLVSRSWTSKKFVQLVRLLVLDEVHLLGEERGSVLEAIVSRTRFISRHLLQKDGACESSNDKEPTRIVGLSTAIANPTDLADWMGIDTTSYGPQKLRGLYNFRPSVRPVPVTVWVQGYAGRHYCPRMATMNKPCYAAIKEHSPVKPALIFVASRRQTRLTALDLISYAAADENPRRFLHTEDRYMEDVASQLSDSSLRHTMQFGIGLHHAGLSTSDRDVVERMFLSGDIQILVATATLAWGVNLPAHLVIVKGTEYFDGKKHGYVDYPLTDVLQMIGRAGRPGFDTEAKAVVMVQEEKKTFYSKFLYSPFPVESCLRDRLPEVLNAEIASGTIQSLAEAFGYMSWTFFGRRVKVNPSYYGINVRSSETYDDDIMDGLENIVESALSLLRTQGCLLQDDEENLATTSLGKAACNYYLNHKTPKQMQLGIRESLKWTKENAHDDIACDFQVSPLLRPDRMEIVPVAWILYALCSTHEFDELPVRHNEEFLNKELSESLPWGPDTASLLSPGAYIHHNEEIYQDPHTKAFLLVQAFLAKIKLPISDYVNDTKTIFDNLPRLLAAMEFIALNEDVQNPGSFEVLTHFTKTRQLLETKTMPDQNPILQLGHQVDGLSLSLFELRRMQRDEAKSRLPKPKADRLLSALYALPLVFASNVTITTNVDKAAGLSTGKLRLDLSVDASTKKRTGPWGVAILVGTCQNQILLGHSSLSLGMHQSRLVTISFDWRHAKAHGGSEGAIVIRCLVDQVRGLDWEQKVKLP